jgi:pectin methylesterase-like acyl-CoA thioesterase
VPFPPLPTAPRLAVKVPPVDRTLYVAADGTGDYYSIQRAIDVAPAGGALISVAPGTYREALRIGKPHIVLRSPYEDAAKTVILAPANAVAMTVTADDFRAENLTLAGDSSPPQARAAASSQVALRVSGKHDIFRNVRVLGKTVHAGR